MLPRRVTVCSRFPLVGACCSAARQTVVLRRRGPTGHLAIGHLFCAGRYVSTRSSSRRHMPGRHQGGPSTEPHREVNGFPAGSDLRQAWPLYALNGTQAGRRGS